MDLSKAKPRGVEAYLRERVREIFGDEVENASHIASSHGYYSMTVGAGEQLYSFSNFRKKDASKIVKALRALKT